jgi:hypothetical protein
MYCKHCGSEVSESVKFCPSCGAQINDPISQEIEEGTINPFKSPAFISLSKKVNGWSISFIIIDIIFLERFIANLSRNLGPQIENGSSLLSIILESLVFVIMLTISFILTINFRKLDKKFKNNEEISISDESIRGIRLWSFVNIIGAAIYLLFEAFNVGSLLQLQFSGTVFVTYLFFPIVILVALIQLHFIFKSSIKAAFN